MRNFAATSMDQENKTDWDSESDPLLPKLRPVGMSDQEEWGDDDLINMGDHPAVANELPAIKYGRIEGADGRAGVPTTSTHPPNPTHSSMLDSSPVADEDMGMTDPNHNIDTRAEEETRHVDVIIEEEYYEQEEGLDYEDNIPMEESPIDIDERKVKCPGIWK